MTSYQWQSSTTNGGTGFTNIGGANTNNYTASQPSVTTWYRMIYSTSSCSNLISPSSKISLNNSIAPVAGTIAGGNVSYCSNTNSTAMTLNGYTATGFQWQSSGDNSTFANISSATSASYTAVNVSSTTYYRAIVSNGPCNPVNSSSVVITKISTTVGTPTSITISSGTEPSCQLTNATTTTTYATTATSNIGFNWSLSNASAGVINATTGVMTWANGFSGTVNIQVTASGCSSTSSQVTRTVTITQTVTINPFSPITSTRCQGAGIITKTTTANNSTGITYSLDATTAAFSGNNINSSTGAVTYAAGWSGTTTITASAAGCNGPAVTTHIVTITPSVTISPFSPTTSNRCQGAGIVTKTTTAYNSTGITYSLDATTAAFSGNSINSSIGAVTYAAGWSGTTTITASAAGCNGPATTNYVVTVDGLPTITGTLSVCIGSTTTLTGSATANAINPWLSATPAVAGISNIGVVTGVSAGTSVITYKNSNGCTTTATVTVNSLVNNTGTGFSSGSFCIGNQATITFDANNGSGVLPYTLLYRNDSTSVTSTVIITTDSPTAFNLSPNPTTTTHYTLLSITDANGCVNSSPANATATATILSLPSTPSIGTINQPTCALATGSVVLTGLPATWSLTRNGTSTATTSGTGTSTTITGLAVGTYAYTVSNGTCTSPMSSNVIIESLVADTYLGGTWSTGSPPTSNQNIIFNSVYASNSTDGNLVACSCQVNSTVVINSGHTLSLTNELTVSGGSLTFENNSSLVQINDVVNTGNITYKRITTPIRKFDYTYWSSPVVGYTLGGVSPNTSLFYSFDAAADNWKPESATTVMSKGIGYIVRGPQNYDPVTAAAFPAVFVGVPNNGAFSLTGISADKLYLIGNPYPSALDADKFLTDNNSVLDGTLYFWTHNTAIQMATNISNGSAGSGTYAYTSDDYAAYNLTGGTGTDGVTYLQGGAAATSGGLKPSGKIASGQAFFAGTQLSPTSNQIVFNNTMRVGVGSITGNNSQFFKITKNEKITKAIEKHRIWLNLTNTQGAFKQMLVGYVTNATNEYDNSFDGESFDGNDFVDFYSVNEDKNLTIQGRALPFDENDKVTLGYSSTIKGTFSITIDEVDGLLVSQDIFIEDKNANIVQNLKQGAYNFSTEAGTFNDRFVLRYNNINTNKSLGTYSVDRLNSSVVVSNKNKHIKINSSDEIINKVQVFDLLGNSIYQKNNVNSNESVITNLAINHQIVLVKIVLQNGQTVTKKIVN